MEWKDPAFLPLVNLIGMGILGVLAFFGQWYGKKKESATTSDRDVVVPSLTIADNSAILGMAETLRESSRIIRDRHDFERDMLSESRRANDLLEEIKYILGRAQRQEKIQ